jgi:hypothetical protein
LHRLTLEAATIDGHPAGLFWTRASTAMVTGAGQFEWFSIGRSRASACVRGFDAAFASCFSSIHAQAKRYEPNRDDANYPKQCEDVLCHVHLTSLDGGLSPATAVEPI